jgi:hypothetical protein
MTATGQQTVERANLAGASAPDCPVRNLFSDWGLEVGRVVSGSWTIDSIERGKEGDAAIAMFSRGPANLRVSFKRAGSEPFFARVGDIDLSHGKVDAELNRDVQMLLRRIAAWLKQHDDGSALASLLASPPQSEGNNRPSPNAVGTQYFEERVAGSRWLLLATRRAL